MQEKRNTHNTHHRKIKKKGGGKQHRRRSPNNPPQPTATAPERGRDGQPPGSGRDHHTRQGTPPGPVRDHAPHTGQLHNPAWEAPAGQPRARTTGGRQGKLKPDHTPHNKVSRGGIRRRPLPTGPTQEPSQEGGGYVPTCTRTRTASPNQERRDGSDTPTLIPITNPATCTQTHAPQTPTKTGKLHARPAPTRTNRKPRP